VDGGAHHLHQRPAARRLFSGLDPVREGPAAAADHIRDPPDQQVPTNTGGAGLRGAGETGGQSRQSGSVASSAAASSASDLTGEPCDWTFLGSTFDTSRGIKHRDHYAYILPLGYIRESVPHGAAAPRLDRIAVAFHLVDYPTADFENYLSEHIAAACNTPTCDCDLCQHISTGKFCTASEFRCLSAVVAYKYLAEQKAHSAQQ